MSEIFSATTGIGSLPHHNIDSALGFSFNHGIPFLPQIPIRNPWEYMIPQALEGLPGLRVERDGETRLNLEIWTNGAPALNERLARAFQPGKDSTQALELFEPSAAASSAWQGFLWELQEAGKSLAKIQIAGPMTCQWALRLEDGAPLDKYPEIESQIFRLVLARALAMTRKMQSSGIRPILFLDEPGLYAYSPSNPRHVSAFHELKLMIQALRKEAVIVGLHCCSNTDWRAILSLDLNYLSIDTGLSLQNLLQSAREELLLYLDRGGKLSLGIIPTARSGALRSLDCESLFEDLYEKLLLGLGDETRLKRVLNEALYTPACGLALQNIPDAELISDSLEQVFRYARQ